MGVISIQLVFKTIRLDCSRLSPIMLLLSLQTKHYQETNKIALIVIPQTSLVLCPQLMEGPPTSENVPLSSGIEFSGNASFLLRYKSNIPSHIAMPLPCPKTSAREPCPVHGYHCFLTHRPNIPGITASLGLHLCSIGCHHPCTTALRGPEPR